MPQRKERKGPSKTIQKRKEVEQRMGLQKVVEENRIY